MPKRAHARSRYLLIAARQVAALWLLSWLAKALASLSPLPLPAGAVGLGVLFALLCAGVVRAQWIEAGADLLVRHLGLFLIPYAVSVISYGELVARSGAAILGTIVASTVIGMAAAGWAAQASARLACTHPSLLRDTQR